MKKGTMIYSTPGEKVLHFIVPNLNIELMCPFVENASYENQLIM